MWEGGRGGTRILKSRGIQGFFQDCLPELRLDRVPENEVYTAPQEPLQEGLQVHVGIEGLRLELDHKIEIATLSSRAPGSGPEETEVPNAISPDDRGVPAREAGESRVRSGPLTDPPFMILRPSVQAAWKLLAPGWGKGPLHQMISRNLFTVLHLHVSTKGLGEVLYAPLDVILSESAIVQPDIVYLDRARLGAISRRGIEGAPTLVVEILSPSTTLIDRSAKWQLYARHGVPFYWLVDPEGRVIEALVLGPDGYSLAVWASGTLPLALPPFPDLALVPAALWP